MSAAISKHFAAVREIIERAARLKGLAEDLRKKADALDAEAWLIFKEADPHLEAIEKGGSK